MLKMCKKVIQKLLTKVKKTPYFAVTLLTFLTALKSA